jgi:hypothetical protein
MSMFWVGVTVVASSVVTAGVSMYEGSKNRAAMKEAQDDATARNDKALADAKAAKDSAAAQAQAQIDAKRRAMTSSQTIFTDPLGLDTKAATAKKTILGA